MMWIMVYLPVSRIRVIGKLRSRRVEMQIDLMVCIATWIGLAAVVIVIVCGAFERLGATSHWAGESRTVKALRDAIAGSTVVVVLI